jgi:hypothetical protein
MATNDDDDLNMPDDDDDDQDQGPSREEHERVKRALAKANNEAKKHRLRLKQYLANKDDDDVDDDKGKKKIDRERIRDEVSEAEETKWKQRVVRQAARAALLEAGLIGDATKLARLVNVTDVEVDDDGDVTDGLQDQIDEIREDYPDLFEDRGVDRKQRRGMRGIDGGDRGGNRPPRKLSSAEKIQELALRGGRR